MDSFFDKLFSDLFGSSLSNPFTEKEQEQPQNFDRETLEFRKGNFLTKVDLIFTKEGSLIGTDSSCEYVGSEEEQKLKLLTEKLKTAIKADNFEDAILIRDQIKELQKPTTEQKQITN